MTSLGQAAAWVWPWWSAAPFGALLLAIALLPQLAPHAWERPTTQAAVSLGLGLPVAVVAAWATPHQAAHALCEYVSFLVLLGSLATCAGGVEVVGGVRPGALANTGLLAVGGALASVVGTTGASMLLFPLLCRLNAGRPGATHVGVFFIFVVGNIGGLLTPLGDPPLFLGFLRGVPFAWTLRLWPVWAGSLAYLLAAFFLLDRRRPAAPAAAAAPLRVEGLAALSLLLGVVACVAAGGLWGAPFGAAEVAMVALAALAYRLTPPTRRARVGFSWQPLIEVAILFAGIFACLLPVAAQVEAHGGRLGAMGPTALFWATGLLSSLLDNAPTYLTVAGCAASAVGLDPAHLGALAAHPEGRAALAAVSMGAVMMGALTYLGNGPNLMVRAMARARGMPMPSFFGYLAWSLAVLLPLFVVVGRWRL